MTFSLPGYQVGELIGYGSHSEVWSAVARATGEPVALKRIPVATQSEARAARTEAALLAVLDHPNLIKFREFVATADAVVLAQELAAGGCLAELIRRRGRLTPAEVASALSPVAAALAHAHDEGVLHGDVSAANILFTAQGQPKLADLGVARLFDAGGSVGTPAYIDPVVAAGGAPGAASDVFSLAAVAFHAVTGEPLWQVTGNTAEQVWQLAAQADLGDLSARLERCPPAMTAALVRALDAEPFRRGTAAELALDLRASVEPVEVVLNAGRVLTRSVGFTARPQFLRPAGEPSPGPDGHVPAEAGGADAGVPYLAPDLTHVARPRVLPSAPGSAGRSRLSRFLAMRKIHLALIAVIIVAPCADWLVTGVTPAQRLGLGSAAQKSTSVHASGPVSSGAALPSGAAASSGAQAPAPGVATSSGAAASSGAQASAPGVATSSGAAASSGAQAPAPGVATSSGAAASSGAQAPAQLTASQVAAVLARLDQRREQAFQARNADLLRQVYADPQLLAQDADELQLIVPPGCSLPGLHTTYRDVSVVSQSAAELVLTAKLTLVPASVTCSGSVRSRTVGLGPVLTKITLKSAGAGFLISSQQLSQV